MIKPQIIGSFVKKKQYLNNKDYNKNILGCAKLFSSTKRNVTFNFRLFLNVLCLLVCNRYEYYCGRLQTVITFGLSIYGNNVLSDIFSQRKLQRVSEHLLQELIFKRKLNQSIVMPTVLHTSIL